MSMFLLGKKRNLFVMALFLSPYFLGFTPVDSDSSWTELKIGIGKGSYEEVSRDCSGRVLSVNDVPFSEAAASVDHYTPVIHLGLKAGVMADGPTKRIFSLQGTQTYNYGVTSATPPGNVYYTSPTIGLNTKYFGLDVGYLLPFDGMFQTAGGIPAGSLRIGRNDAFYFRIRLADDLPLITGGPGVANVGFGFNLGEPQRSMWLGLGVIPYDALMFGTQFEFPLSDNVLIHLGGSYGAGESSMYGLSAGTRIHF